jgi:hypothetical protein
MSRQAIAAAPNPARCVCCRVLFGFVGIERLRKYWPPLLCPATTPPTDPDNCPPNPNRINIRRLPSNEQHDHNTVISNSNHYVSITIIKNLDDQIHRRKSLIPKISTTKFIVANH